MGTQVDSASEKWGREIDKLFDRVKSNEGEVIALARDKLAKKGIGATEKELAENLKQDAIEHKVTTDEQYKKAWKRVTADMDPREKSARSIVSRAKAVLFYILLHDKGLGTSTPDEQQRARQQIESLSDGALERVLEQQGITRETYQQELREECERCKDDAPRMMDHNLLLICFRLNRHLAEDLLLCQANIGKLQKTKRLSAEAACQVFARSKCFKACVERWPSIAPSFWLTREIAFAHVNVTHLTVPLKQLADLLPMGSEIIIGSHAVLSRTQTMPAEAALSLLRLVSNLQGNAMAARECLIKALSTLGVSSDGRENREHEQALLMLKLCLGVRRRQEQGDKHALRNECCSRKISYRDDPTDHTRNDKVKITLRVQRWERFIAGLGPKANP